MRCKIIYTCMYITVTIYNTCALIHSLRKKVTYLYSIQREKEQEEDEFASRRFSLTECLESPPLHHFTVQCHTACHITTISVFILKNIEIILSAQFSELR